MDLHYIEPAVSPLENVQNAQANDLLIFRHLEIFFANCSKIGGHVPLQMNGNSPLAAVRLRE